MLAFSFLVFASRRVNTTRSANRIKFAIAVAKGGLRTPGSAVRASSTAADDDVMSDTLLPAFKKPINPPMSSSTM